MIKKYKQLIYIALFLIWGMFVVVCYFYNFPYYGEAFISSILLLVTFILCLVNIAVLTKIIAVLFNPNFEIINFIKSKVKIITNKLKNRKIPLLYFPIFLYLSSILWIIEIFFKSEQKTEILVNNLTSLLLLSWLFIISFSLGYKILKILKYKTQFFLEKFIFSCSLGFGVLMFIMYFLGMFGLYYRSIAYVGMLVISAITLKEIKELWLFIKNRENGWNIKKTLSINNILILLAVIILGIYISGMFQQFPSGFDALISYSTYPKTYVENHGIVNFPHWIYFGFPQNGEMLFSLGYLLYGFQITAGIIFIFTLLIALGIYYFFKKNNIKGGLFTTIIYLTIPVISFQNLEDHKIEMIFVFYTVLSYIALINYLKSKNKKDLILLGLFCGLAAGLKYFFITWFIFPIIIVFLIQILRKKVKFKHFILWSLIIFILMSPWFIKNVIFSGNPLDPILSEQFAINQEFYNAIGDDVQSYNMNEMRNETYLLWDDVEPKGIVFFLEHIFNITFGGDKKYISDSLSIGFLFILFLPVIIGYYTRKIINKKLEKELVVLFFSSILLYILWIYIGHSVMWYAISLFIMLAILFGKIFYIKDKYLTFLFKIFLIIWVVAMINNQFFKRISYPTLYIQYPEKEIFALYSISEYINENYDNNSMLWGIDEARGYYINSSNSRYIPDHYSLLISYLLKNKDNKKVFSFFKDFNIKYFLWHGISNSKNLSERMLWAKMPNGSEEYANFTLDNYKRVIKFKNEHMELIAHEGEYYLYKLKEE